MITIVVSQHILRISINIEVALKPDKPDKMRLLDQL
jgi:hypothetical protein